MADWYAFEELENAWEKTRDILLPFDLGTWLRLLLLVIFTGGMGVNAPTSFGDFGGSDYDGGAENVSPTSALDNITAQPMTSLATGNVRTYGLIAVIGILFVSLVLFFLLISSILELVYYQSLIDENVRIRKNFRKHFRKGLSYFGLILATVILTIGLFGISALVLGAVSTIVGILLLFGSVLVLIPIAVALGLTNNFVLPRMIEAEENIVDAWKNVYPDLRAEWKQVVVYVIVRFFVKTVAGILSIFWMITTLLVIGLPLAIIGALLYLVVEWLIVIPIIIGLVLWVISLIVFQIPVQTYLYSYALLIYHDLTS